MARDPQDEARRKQFIRGRLLSDLRKQLRPDQSPADATVQRIFADLQQVHRTRKTGSERSSWDRLLTYLLTHPADA